MVDLTWPFKENEACNGSKVAEEWDDITEHLVSADSTMSFQTLFGCEFFLCFSASKDKTSRLHATFS